MVHQSGKRINLRSKDDIPYLTSGDDSETYDNELAGDIHDILTRNVVVTDAPAVVGEDGEEGDDPGVADVEVMEVPDDVEDEHEGGGLIEVDIHEGEKRMAKPGALKAEAKKIALLLTHRYRNTYRAKMNHFRSNQTGSMQTQIEEMRWPYNFDFADME